MSDIRFKLWVKHNDGLWDNNKPWEFEGFLRTCKKYLTMCQNFAPQLITKYSLKWRKNAMTIDVYAISAGQVRRCYNTTVNKLPHKGLWADAFPWEPDVNLDRVHIVEAIRLPRFDMRDTMRMCRDYGVRNPNIGG